MIKLNLSRVKMVLVLLVLSAVVGVTIAWTAWAYYAGGKTRLGPEQPIPFSHRLHVTDKDIDCRFCHTGVDRVPSAGIPAVQTCMFCHKVIITQHPEIVKLWEHFDHRDPIPWQRVFEVPDHVYFTHRVHTNVAQLECADCHGAIEQMDRLQAQREFKMGFCLECHRPRGASTDCWTCHH